MKGRDKAVTEYENLLRWRELTKKCVLLGCAKLDLWFKACDEVRAYEMRYNHNHDEKGRFCSGDGVDKGGKGDIIKMTKLSANGAITAPMDKDRYIKMKNALESQCCTVIAAAGDDERFLKAIGAEAISDEYGIIHLGEIPSASAFFEEIIHYTQVRKYGGVSNDDYVERAAREVAANRKLLKHGKAYGFSDDDFDDIRRNLKFWENDFERRVGVSYDSGKIKRDI